jgi:hypothetical protein
MAADDIKPPQTRTAHLSSMEVIYLRLLYLDVNSSALTSGSVLESTECDVSIYPDDYRGIFGWEENAEFLKIYLGSGTPVLRAGNTKR